MDADADAESSRAGLLRRRDSSSEEEHGGSSEADEEHAADVEAAEDAAERATLAKERRFDAKRKRILFLENLLRELDTLVFLELITIYHLEYVLSALPFLRSRPAQCHNATMPLLHMSTTY
jgi:hypothetical protein